MAYQNFANLTKLPPIANLTAIVATTETALWNAQQFTPIYADEAYAGKVWEVTAFGIMSFAATGTLTLTPRFGLTVAGVTMGASVAQTTPGATTNQPWFLRMIVECRTVGAPGANSTVIGAGHFGTNGAGTAGTAIAMHFGGTQATVDVSVLSGITIGWTLSVAGTVTPQFAMIRQLN
jgi:hypothetical protein